VQGSRDGCSSVRVLQQRQGQAERGSSTEPVPAGGGEEGLGVCWSRSEAEQHLQRHCCQLLLPLLLLLLLCRSCCCCCCLRLLLLLPICSKAWGLCL